MKKNKSIFIILAITLIMVLILLTICYFKKSLNNVNNVNICVNNNNNNDNSLNITLNNKYNIEKKQSLNKNAYNSINSDNDQNNYSSHDNHDNLIFNKFNHDNPNIDELKSASSTMFTQLFNIDNNYDFLIKNIDNNFSQLDKDSENLAYLLYTSSDKSILKINNATIHFLSVNSVDIVDNNFEYCIYKANIYYHVIQGPMQADGYTSEYDMTTTWTIKISRYNKIMSIKKCYE